MFSALDLLTAIFSFLILFFAFKVILYFKRGEILEKRLKELMVYRDQLLQKQADEKRIFESKHEEVSPLSKLMDKFFSSGAAEKEKLRKLFIKAGLDPKSSLVIYSLGKIVMLVVTPTITAAILYLFVDIYWLYGLVIVLIAAFLGSYSVEFVLKTLVNIRQEKIRKAFPDALDLMVICAEAGLSLTATVQRVAREITQVAPDLGYELALLSIELNMFSDRKKALQNFSDRLDSPYFKAIIANIIQAEQYGTPIAQTMRTVAEQFRLDRVVEAEERAAKLPVMMTLPMMVFIFPCIYLVILGPAIINVIHNFQ